MWLASYPGGIPLLYLQLFVVKSGEREVSTLCRDPNVVSYLLELPPELRNMIYSFYSQRHDRVKHADEEHAPFLSDEGKELQRLCLSSEDIELKSWLSTALLQPSSQLRHEAMPTFFESCVFTVEWLPCLPRFVNFWGEAGCAMVRYLEILDTLNSRMIDLENYNTRVTSASHFHRLRHLRIVLSWDNFGSRAEDPWFDANEWTPLVVLKDDAVAKMRCEDIEIN